MNAGIRVLTNDEISYVSGGTNPNGPPASGGRATGGGDGLGWLRNTVRAVAEGVSNLLHSLTG